MERDLEALLPLPPAPYDACDKQAGRVRSLSLVRYRTNDYSVPVAYGHREVLVRGYVDQVVISCGTEVIARHSRSYERDDFIYDPIHYLPLLERKTGALDQAAPLQGWDLPQEFDTLRRLLEARMGRRGKREYVQVLRLLETFSQQEVVAAVRDAIRLGDVSFDAVKHLVLCRLEGRPPKLDLELYPYLPQVRVGTTSTKDYMSLLSGRRHEPEVHADAGTPTQGAEAGQLPEGVPEDGRPVRRRERGPPGVSAPSRRTGTHRPPPAHGGAADPGRPIPGSQELGHL